MGEDMNNEQRNERDGNQLRLSIIAWLESNDPNGVYSDEDCIAEFGRIMTLGEAIGSAAYQVDDITCTYEVTK